MTANYISPPPPPRKSAISYKISGNGWLIMTMPNGDEVVVFKLTDAQVQDLRFEINDYFGL